METSKTKPPLAVSFDLDETLIDKEPTGTLAFIDYCSNAGLPVQRHHFAVIEKFRQKYFADSAAVSQSIAAKGSKTFWLHYNSLVLHEVLGYTPEISLIEALTEKFTKEYRPRVLMFDDVRETLKRLKELGIPMGIITTRNAGVDLGINLGKVEHELADLGVAEYFSFIIGLSPTGQAKPHASVFAAAAAAVKVSIEELLHVGNDIYADYEGALEAGAQGALLDRHELFTDVTGRISSMNSILTRFTDAIDA
jgi:FMN phosphatase YigB (HAD superfamily)